MVAALRRLDDLRAIAIGYAAVVFVTAFLAAAAPGFMDHLGDASVRGEVAAAVPIARNLQLAETTRIDPGSADPLAPVQTRGDALQRELPPGVRALVTDRVLVVDSPRFSAGSQTREQATVVLRLQQGVATRVTFSAGRSPSGATQQGSIEVDGRPVPVLVVEGAVSTATASALGVGIGTRLDLAVDQTDQMIAGLSVGDARVAVEVVGIFEATDPGATYWYGENGLIRTSLRVFSPERQIVDARVLIDDGAYRSLVEFTGPAGVPFQYQFRLFIDPARITVRGLSTLTADLRQAASIFPRSAVQARAVGTAQLTTSLDRLVSEAHAHWTVATGLVSMAAVGPVAMATAALALIALISGRRRRPVVRVWRARGASTAQVLLATMSEGMLLALPAAALACALAMFAVGGGAAEAGLMAAAAVSVGATLLIGLAEVTSDRPDLGDERAPSPTSPRRLALELVVVVVAVAGTYLLRERGLSATEAGPLAVDPLLAAAPALAAIAAALVARRLIPVPLGALAHLTARRRDLAPVLAMRRARRQGGPTTVMIVLLASATSMAFAATALLTLDQGSDYVAWQTVGAPFRITSLFGGLPVDLDPGRLPGVRSSAGAYRGLGSVNLDAGVVDVLAVDAAGLQGVSGGTPADPAFPAPMLSPASASADVSAIISPEAATRAHVTHAGETFTLRVRSQPVLARVEAIRTSFPSLADGGSFAVVSRQQVEGRYPTLSLTTTDLFLDAPDEASGALGDALAGYGPSVIFEGRASTWRTLHERPVTRAVTLAVLVTALAAAAYAALALIAGLALAGSARATEVAHLRLLGLSRRGAAGMLVLEYGPVLVLALVAGAALGLGLFLGLQDVLGFGTLLGSTLPIPLTIEPVHLVAIGATATAVAGAAVGVAEFLQVRAAPAAATRRGIE